MYTPIINVNELYHHGIKGQKWGVRRFQNPDGSLTSNGKARYARMNKARRRIIQHRMTTKDVNDIVESLNLHDKKLLGAPIHEKWIEPEYETEVSTNIAKRIVTTYNDMPVSFIEVWDNGGNIGEIALATRSGSDYRGKGFASNNVKQILNWYDKYGYKQLDSLQWNVDRNNATSRALAEKFGFREISKKEYDAIFSSGWDKYTVYKYSKR